MMNSARCSKVHVFLDQALAKAHLEESRSGGPSRYALRQQTVEAAIKTFEDTANEALATLTGAGSQMRGASDEMASVSAARSRACGPSPSRRRKPPPASPHRGGDRTTQWLDRRDQPPLRHAAGITSARLRKPSGPIQRYAGSPNREQDRSGRATHQRHRGTHEFVGFERDDRGRARGDAGKGSGGRSEVKSLATQTAQH